MTTDDLKHTSDYQEELLLRAVEMIEQGHQLTDEEMALLTDNAEAAEAYRQLMALRDVVQTPVPEVPQCRVPLSGHTEQAPLSSDDDTDEQSTFLTGNRLLWGLLAAAAILLALMVTYPTLQKKPATAEGLLVYEHTEKPDGIILKTNQGKAVNIQHSTPGTRHRTLNTKHSSARLSTDKGQLVLDYQALQQQGYAVSTEVETNTVEIPCGKDFKLVLADGTEVWLNADSRLVYPSHFIEAERRVYLEGEAYFRVTKDSEHPFVITTNQMEARVLGTELNVSCREDGSNPHVALINGSVEVNTKGRQRALLTPGLGASVVGRQLVVGYEDMDPYIYWRNGYVYFDNATLTDIAHSLGRWFNVSVALSNEQLGNLQLHFLYKRGDSLRSVVNILNGFRKFRADVKDNTLVIQPMAEK